MTERKKMSVEEVASSDLLVKLEELQQSVGAASLIGRHRLGNPEGEWPWDQIDSIGRINRQVALAVYSNLLDFWGGKRDKAQIVKYTGKIPSHWNFQLLGTQKELYDDPKYHLKRERIEQRTTNYFVVTLLTALKEEGISFDWDHFADVMASCRFRVISKPWNSDVRATDAWEESGVRDNIGVDYPAPWDIAMRFGEERAELDHDEMAEIREVISFYPCRIENLGVKSFLLSDDDIQGDKKISRWCLKGIGEPKSVEGPAAGSIQLKQAEAQIMKLSLDLAKAMEKIKEQEMRMQMIAGRCR